MISQPIRSLISIALTASLCCIPPVLADSRKLPEIGTVAGTTLTIAQEKQYGDAYMRVLRSHQPVINDPVLNQYINTLGHKLVANADNVKTPFTFFLIRKREINAFAFFGGYVALHSGLFLHTRSESELASVMSHEIAHITQRHLARSMEAEAKRSPATIAALVGSLLLTIAAPEAGIAAMTATQAGSVQQRINYTRENEKEADRFGIETLAKSGFDPYAMPRFFGKLAAEYQYASKPPAMLLTHPLPESRITDSRERAQQYSHVNKKPSLAYQLARIRVIVRFTGIKAEAASDWIQRHRPKHKSEISPAFDYGQALIFLDEGKLDKAEAILTRLLKSSPKNHFYLDAMSDVYIDQNQPEKAVHLLEKLLAESPHNQVLAINDANALIKAKKYKDATQILHRYTHDFPHDPNGWNLLSKASALSDDEPEDLAARAEILALKANWDQAIQYYTQASQLSKLGSLQQARYDARIDQLIAQREQFLALQE
ncbi:beta-barrel assembly-enhancing protease [Vibrio quintilis]|uniref:Putative beta-barrel assembly-enhancing protease n=1 Tax=Vibrio quintilis TaxID=1117707 RepID=A0A1M7YTA8_9VIBR|nr:M48 family metallopeptidase [Vibrio quintilis]SHO55829.1 TPR repeat-containing protein YfgC precursor [Vibrio quintilis]